MDKRQTTPRPSSRNESPGSVSINEVYRVDEIKRRMGWSDAAFRAAKRRGLKVCRDGKRVYVSGREVMEYLAARSNSPPGILDDPTCASR
jgi:hypothetical protein